MSVRVWVFCCWVFCASHLCAAPNWFFYGSEVPDPKKFPHPCLPPSQNTSRPSERASYLLNVLAHIVHPYNSLVFSRLDEFLVRILPIMFSCLFVSCLCISESLSLSRWALWNLLCYLCSDKHSLLPSNSLRCAYQDYGSHKYTFIGASFFLCAFLQCLVKPTDLVCLKRAV